MEILTDEILMNGIFPFIGEYHFRYIAGINRQFHRAYTPISIRARKRIFSMATWPHSMTKP